MCIRDSHLAGEFCPEESRQEVSLLGYQREDVGGAGAEDAKYFLGVTQEAGPCTVHTAAQPDPDLPFDPNQPWDPSDPWNPNTNPLDPTGQGGGGAAEDVYKRQLHSWRSLPLFCSGPIVPRLEEKSKARLSLIHI